MDIIPQTVNEKRLVRMFLAQKHANEAALKQIKLAQRNPHLASAHLSQAEDLLGGNNND